MHIFFIVIQYIGLIILGVEAFYVIGHKSSRTQQYLSLLILALGINFVGYLIELQANTLGEALIATKFSYLGLILCYVSFYLLCRSAG